MRNQIGLEATEGRDETRIIEELVNGCERNGYITHVGHTGKIRMTAAGIVARRYP
jgi:hypothetical protein